MGFSARCCVIALVGLASFPAAVSGFSETRAQKSVKERGKSDYILILDQVDSNLFSTLSSAGITPQRQIGRLLWVRMKESQSGQAGQIKGVKRVMPAEPVLVQLKTDAPDISADMDVVEGILTQRYPEQNAVGAVVPVIRIPDLMHLRQVYKVTRQTSSKTPAQP